MAEAKAYEQEYGQYEIIDGKTVMMSPAATNHRRIQRNLSRIIGNYLLGKRCELFLEEDVYFEDKSHFIPDLIIVCDKNKIKEFHVEGAPDLVVEVLSPSTAKNDIGHKKDVYEACGVKEYWIVSPGDKTVTQYQLRDGRFVLHEVYAVHPEVMLAKMREEERAAVITEFKCCLFDDLLIPVADIFDRVM